MTTDWVSKVPAVVSRRNDVSRVRERTRWPSRVVDVGFGALALEHGDDGLGGVVAEELAEGFFVVGDAVLFDEGDDVGWGVAGECGLCEVGVLGEEVFGATVDVGEVAASAAGDEDFFAGFFGVVEQEDSAVAAAGFDGAHEAGCACAEDGDVDVFSGDGFKTH